jgi:hypothetical protein
MSPGIDEGNTGANKPPSLGLEGFGALSGVKKLRPLPCIPASSGTGLEKLIR